MLASAAIAPWYFLQALFGFFIQHRPEIIPFVDASILIKLNSYLLCCSLFWLAAFVVTLRLRKSQEKNDLLEWSLILISVPMVLPIVATYGILMSSVLSAMAAASILGLFLFETRKMVVAVFFNLGLSAAIGGIAFLGMVPVSFLHQEITLGLGALWWWIGQIIIAMYPLFCGILMTIFFLKGLRDREEKIRELSRKDGLTNIWNRRYLMEIFERELKVAKRNNKPISFIMIDLDHFKSINDNYGHKMGDAAIETASRVLQKALRTTDSLGRYGGEEFAAVLPDCSDVSAREVAERCRMAVEETIVKYNDMTVQLTASVGVATTSDLSKTGADAIIDQADKALYKSKASGRNKVSFFCDKVCMNLAGA